MMGCTRRYHNHFSPAHADGFARYPEMKSPIQDLKNVFLMGMNMLRFPYLRRRTITFYREELSIGFRTRLQKFHFLPRTGVKNFPLRIVRCQLLVVSC